MILEGDILLLEVILTVNHHRPPLLLPNQEQYLPGVRKELKLCEAKTVESSVDEPPEVELKELPPHLEYAFLEGDDKLPVIKIAKDLKDRKRQHLHRIPIDPKDQEKTTFTCPYGIFAYRRSAFWLCNAPAKVKVIAKLPHPTTVKGVRSFLGHGRLFAIGAVLGQRKNKHFQPIHYASKTMNEAQTHYTTTEKELLAVVYAFEKFRSYLVMSKSIVYTDQLRISAADQELSDLENPHQDKLETRINEHFPLETLFYCSSRSSTNHGLPDFAIYHAGKIRYQRNDIQQKNKFLKECQNIITGEDPFLLRICADQVDKSCDFFARKLRTSQSLHSDLLGDTMCQITQQEKSFDSGSIGPPLQGCP
ncbi:reverse transcriptase domain-containing protein [Tanacetum coccineum]